MKIKSIFEQAGWGNGRPDLSIMRLNYNKTGAKYPLLLKSYPMSSYLLDIARRDTRVVRAVDFPSRSAGKELRRLANAGALLHLCQGYYALIPESRRGDESRWRPEVEAAALGIAIADYGVERVALIGPSAARLQGCYPRALSTAVVAVPSQRPMRETVAGKVKFVVRDVSKLDLVRVDTELTRGWMTSVEETMLDLSGDWPRWPISETARTEMLELLAAQASNEILNKIVGRSRNGAAFRRLKGIMRDQSPGN